MAYEELIAKCQEVYELAQEHNHLQDYTSATFARQADIREAETILGILSYRIQTAIRWLIDDKEDASSTLKAIAFAKWVTEHARDVVARTHSTFWFESSQGVWEIDKSVRDSIPKLFVEEGFLTHQ